MSFSLHKKPYSCHNCCYLCSAASRTTLKPKQLMVKPIYNSLWTPRRSAAHSRTEVTCFYLNQGVSFLWNSSIPTSTTSEEWEREETLFRLIQPWNIASLLNALQLLPTMSCASSGLVSVWRSEYHTKLEHARSNNAPSNRFPNTKQNLRHHLPDRLITYPPVFEHTRWQFRRLLRLCKPFFILSIHQFICNDHLNNSYQRRAI